MDAAEAGKLNSPTGVKVDGEGAVWVVDRGNNRVLKLNRDGEVLAVLGSEGFGEGEFQVPTGIAVDRNGAVYVSEVDNHRVQIFDSAGEFLSKLTSGLLNGPHGLAFDSAGNLYVADTGHNYVRKFKPVDLPASAR